MSNTRKALKITALFTAIILLILALLTASSVLFPRFTTGLFFGVNTNPIELTIKDSFEPRPTDAKTQAILLAAKAFIATLSNEQSAAALYSFADNEQRSKWSNFPEGMIPRGGLRLGNLSPEQQQLLDQLLAEIMSEQGLLNIAYQLAAEETFEKDSFNKYGIEHFYVAFLGTPSASLPWMFQFGGHHLAINTTIYGADVTFSPMLTGGQPLNIEFDGKQVFITEKETRAAKVLMASLTLEQRNQAIRGEKPIDLLLGPGEFGAVVAAEGIKASELNTEQRQLLIDLIYTRLGFINKDDLAAKMTSVRAELDDTYFAWWGPIDKLGFGYFRITGPSLFIEYSPQDDQGDPITDHAHSMFRNPKNDYGSAWISQ